MFSSFQIYLTNINLDINEIWTLEELFALKLRLFGVPGWLSWWNLQLLILRLLSLSPSLGVETT